MLEEFNRAKNGDLSDSEIGNSMVESLDFPGAFNMYISMFGTLREFRYARPRLIKSFATALEELATNGFFFREICANAFTDDGRYICDKLGMTRRGPHKDYGTVYTLPLDPWPCDWLILPWSQKLANLYQIGLRVQTLKWPKIVPVTVKSAEEQELPSDLGP